MEIGILSGGDIPARVIRKRKINPPASRNPFEIVSEALADLSDRGTFKVGVSRSAVNEVPSRKPTETAVTSLTQSNEAMTSSISAAGVTVKRLKSSVPATIDFKQTRQQIQSVQKEQHTHCNCCGGHKMCKPEVEFASDPIRSMECTHESLRMVKAPKNDEYDLPVRRRSGGLNIGTEGLSGSFSFHQESQYARNFKQWDSSSFSPSKLNRPLSCKHCYDPRKLKPTNWQFTIVPEYRQPECHRKFSNRSSRNSEQDSDEISSTISGSSNDDSSSRVPFGCDKITGQRYGLKNHLSKAKKQMPVFHYECQIEKVSNFLDKFNTGFRGSPVSPGEKQKLNDKYQPSRSTDDTIDKVAKKNVKESHSLGVHAGSGDGMMESSLGTLAMGRPKQTHLLPQSAVSMATAKRDAASAAGAPFQSSLISIEEDRELGQEELASESTVCERRSLNVPHARGHALNVGYVSDSGDVKVSKAHRMGAKTSLTSSELELSSSTGAEVPGLKLKQWWMKGGGGSQESSSNPEAGLERKVPSFKSPSSSERKAPSKEYASKSAVRSSERVNFSKDVSEVTEGGSKKIYNKTPVPMHKSNSLSTETCRSSYSGSVTTASKEAPCHETPKIGKHSARKRDPELSAGLQGNPTLSRGKVNPLALKPGSFKAVDPNVLTQELLQLQLDKIKKTNYILLQRASAHKLQSEKKPTPRKSYSTQIVNAY